MDDCRQRHPALLWVSAALVLFLLAGCRPPFPVNIAAPDTASQRPVAARVAPSIVAAQEPVVIALAPGIPSAATELDRRLAQLGEGFDGDVGLAVRDIQTGWTSHHRGLDYFPQQSVSKLWVALTVLDRTDRGALSLDAPLTVGQDDLTLFHQPIRALASQPGGYRTNTGDLLVRALTQSDNTANDVLLRQVGGPAAVRSMLDGKSLTGIRFGPGERGLQSRIAGLEWRPDYAIGNRFYIARDAIPEAVRQAAFDAYVAQPVDGATPLAMVDALAQLKSGRLLSAPSSLYLMSVMAQTRTGPTRLKGGLPAGWTLSHKTGTGQILHGEQAGYNDVGILTAPDGRAYAVAVLIGRTSRPLQERRALMHRVVEAAVAYNAALDLQQARHPVGFPQAPKM